MIHFWKVNKSVSKWEENNFFINFFSIAESAKCISSIHFIEKYIHVSFFYVVEQNEVYVKDIKKNILFLYTHHKNVNTSSIANNFYF